MYIELINNSNNDIYCIGNLHTADAAYTPIGAI